MQPGKRKNNFSIDYDALGSATEKYILLIGGFNTYTGNEDADIIVRFGEDENMFCSAENVLGINCHNTNVPYITEEDHSDIDEEVDVEF